MQKFQRSQLPLIEKKIFLLLPLLVLAATISAQTLPRVMVIFAHPDEGEIYTGGTTALFTRMGSQVKFMSLTNGDAGHYSMKPADLAKKRYQEAMDSKNILKLADYEVLDYHDQYLKNTKESRDKVIKSIREFKPDIVFTYYAAKGGHTDNMTAGYIVRDAAVDLQMEKMPVFIYIRDFHTYTFTYIPDFAIDIDAVWDTKIAACTAQQSQIADALPHSMGILDQVRADKEKQKQLIYENTYPFSKVTIDNMPALIKWYGKKKASQIRYAEAFEIAEFGRQVTEDELKQLFPMLNNSWTIAGNKNWTNTGLDLTVGDTVEITATGNVIWKFAGRVDSGPDGDLYSTAGGRPIAANGMGALIGRIGDETKEVFFVGSNKTIVADRAGKLWLGINDDKVVDNEGEFRAWIRIVRN